MHSLLRSVSHVGRSPLDRLMHLAQREGVDIRPTLLRVLTDLYVQSPTHSAAERQQYSELASRLIADVDDTTRERSYARAWQLTPMRRRPCWSASRCSRFPHRQ